MSKKKKTVNEKIANELEKANKLTIEKQKAELKGMLTKSEKEWLKEKAV